MWPYETSIAKGWHVLQENTYGDCFGRFYERGSLKNGCKKLVMATKEVLLQYMFAIAFLHFRVR
jgi:hypothetical protein